MTRPLTSVVLWCLLLGGSALLSGTGSVALAEQRLALLAVGVAVAYTAGRSLPRAVACGYGLAAATAVAATVVLTPDGLSGTALAGPLGYGNANGALCAQGAVAALVPFAACRRSRLRLPALALGLALVALAAQTGSRAGAAAGAAGVLVLLVGVLVLQQRHARVLVVAAGVTSAAALSVTVALGAAYDADGARSGRVDRLVDRTLSERRVALWADSLHLMWESPARGVGVGGFAEASPTARADADARWGHSAFLQHGAEAGVPGLVALLGVCAAGYYALWRAAGHSSTAVVGACAATASLVQAGIDYVFHFPVVPLLTALTVGACTTGTVPRRGNAEQGRRRRQVRAGADSAP